MAIHDILEISRQGLAAQQKALTTTANNITNVNTPNYSRQRTEIHARASSMKGGHRMGGGVEVGKVIRVHDKFVQKQIFDQSKTLGDLRMRNELLRQTEGFVQRSGEGISEQLTQFFNDFRQLSVNPEVPTLRVAVKESGAILSNSIRQMSDSLSMVQRDMHMRLESELDQVNQMARELARLNTEISHVEVMGKEPNEMYDTRDGILRNLSQKLGFTSNTDERGQVNIIIPGVGTLVTGGEANQFVTMRTPENDYTGEGLSDIYLKERTGTHLVTPSLKEGEVAGILHVRDQVIQGAQNHLDQLATQLSKAVNEAHQKGVGLDLESGRDFFAPTGEVSGAAARLSLSEAVARSPEAIAVGHYPMSAGDNRIALDIAEIGNSQVMADMTVEGEGAEPRYTFNESVNFLIGNVAQQTQDSDRLLQHQEGMMEQFENYRQSISGVSLEEEAINLMQQQTAFNAAAKMLRIGDELLETIMNLKD